MFSESEKRLRHLQKSWVRPYFSVPALVRLPRQYLGFVKDIVRYRAMDGAEQLDFMDTLPQLVDRTDSTKFDAHYLYQSYWALQAIRASDVESHIDIGSLGLFVGMVAAITNVTFVDIRPLKLVLDGYQACEGSLVDLPFRHNGLMSVSCLHVAEHVGLGRYGDPLDPYGTLKSARELSRVLSPGGRLYFSLPIGKQRVCFNAHRVHSPLVVMDYFSELDLLEFSVVDDRGQLQYSTNPHLFCESHYSCGLFMFSKP